MGASCSGASGIQILVLVDQDVMHGAEDAPASLFAALEDALGVRLPALEQRRRLADGSGEALLGVVLLGEIGSGEPERQAVERPHVHPPPARAERGFESRAELRGGGAVEHQRSLRSTGASRDPCRAPGLLEGASWGSPQT